MTKRASGSPRSLTFRLFVSSTFTDMKAERNALQEHVFPKLRDYCQSRGCRFQAIDLRWGVREEAAFDQQTMTICMEELRRCQRVTPKPNFIVLLGNRYGWQPLPPRILAHEFEALLERLPEAEQARLRFNESRAGIPQGEGNGWYRLDENAAHQAEDGAVQAEYVLLPRQGVFRDQEMWAGEEWSLMGSLRAAAEVAFSNPADEVRRRKYFQSATHQEIQQGALSVEDSHVFAYLRDIKGLPRNASAKDFLDLKPDDSFDRDAWERHEALKAALREKLPEDHVHGFEASWPYQPSGDDLARFCSRAEADLTRVIRSQIDVSELVSPLDAENEAHEAFATERTQHFLGRARQLEEIGTYLRDGAGSPLFVHGESGSGKTALMAKAWLACVDRQGAAEAQESHERAAPVYLFRAIGATPGSTQIRSLLSDLGRQIGRAFCIEESGEAPDEIERLFPWFVARLARATADQPVVLFLDALDQLSTNDGAHNLAWLPRELPAHVRVAASILERPGEPAGRCLENANRQFAASRFVAVEPLASEDADELLSRWLNAAERTLQPANRDAILGSCARDGSRLPLWLRIAFEEARHWTSFAPAEHPPLEQDAKGLIGQWLDRLSRPEEHGVLLVERALGYLAAARHGLSEEEIRDVLACDDTYWADFLESAHHDLPGAVRQLPVIVWSRLNHDLGSFLSERSADGTSLLGFYHRVLRETVEKRVLTGRARWERHEHLADYFGKPPRTSRTLSEWPWHLAQSGSWTALHDCLCDLSVLDPLWRRHRFDVLEYWHMLEVESRYRIAESYSRIVQDLGGHGAEALCLLDLCRQTGNLDVALLVSSTLADAAHADQDAATLLTISPFRADILRRLGRTDEAKREFERLTALAKQANDPYLEQLGMGNLALIKMRRGQWDEALSLLEGQERICRHIQNPTHLGEALLHRSIILWRRGDPDSAERLLEEAEGIARREANHDALQACVGERANVLLSKGEIPKAMDALWRQEHICRDYGMQSSLMVCLSNEAQLFHMQGDRSRAMSLYREVERLACDSGDEAIRQSCLGNQGTLFQESGDLQEAERLFQEQEKIARRIGDAQGLQSALGRRGTVLFARGDYAEALDLFEEQEGICRRLGLPGFLGASLVNQASLLFAHLDRPEAALTKCREALSLLKGVTDMPGALEKAQTLFDRIRHQGSTP